MNKKIYILILSSFLLLLHTPIFADKLNLAYSKKSPKTEKKYSLGGQLTLKDSVKGGRPYISASATWKPDSKNYWFVRGTARHNFDEDDQGFRYSWGLGYDDWHTGTWTVQLNNYETLRIGDGLKVEKAIASIGYKLDLKFLKENKLKSTVSLNKQIEGDTKLSTSIHWSPRKNWFIKGILIAPLEGGGGLRYNYLFGYDDWRPKSFGFEYSNYESNPLGETNFSDGRIALTYKWKFK